MHVLRTDEVRVWRIDVNEAQASRLEMLLSDDERERAAQFAVAAARRRFVVARGATRVVFGRVLARHPRELHFALRCAACSATDHGKPLIAGAEDEFDFNVSHSGDLVLIALGHARAVGVDIEVMRESIDIDRLARRALSAGERAELERLAPAERRDAFYRAWTRKEAYLKARGLGLAGGLDRWTIASDGSVTVAAAASDTAQGAHWRVRSLDVEPGYQAAVASTGLFGVRVESLDPVQSCGGRAGAGRGH